MFLVLVLQMLRQEQMLKQYLKEIYFLMRQKYSLLVDSQIQKEISQRSLQIDQQQLLMYKYLKVLLTKQLLFLQRFKILYLSILYLLFLRQSQQLHKLIFLTMRLVMSTSLRMLLYWILTSSLVMLLLTLLTHLSLLVKVDY